jgi:hypothetical protein
VVAQGGRGLVSYTSIQAFVTVASNNLGHRHLNHMKHVAYFYYSVLILCLLFKWLGLYRMIQKSRSIFVNSLMDEWIATFGSPRIKFL